MTTHVRATLFNGLEPEAADAIAALGASRKLGAGAVLFALGDAADNLYLIERGRIALTLPMDVCGRDEDILVEERLPGETVGWSALVPPYRFTLKATALIDTQVLAIPRTALLDHFSAHPDVGRIVTGNVAAVVGQRLQVFQAMWLREVHRAVKLQVAARPGVVA